MYLGMELGLWSVLDGQEGEENSAISVACVRFHVNFKKVGNG